VVSLISPTRETGEQALTLPGNLQAFYNAAIYSRVSGYVHAWYPDIGAKVKSGQLLATIDTPELDQQLIQARANLASAEADRDLARTTDVDRYLAFKAFSRIVAPFAGVVTARKTDIGALVNAGSSASTTGELFDVAKVDRLRLYVSVPQSESARLEPGAAARLTVPEYPGRSFPATLVTTANAVSDRTGTLLVELLVDNSDGSLKAGDYAEVKFDAPAVASGALLVPSSALLFRKTGMEAAVVGADDLVHLRPVKVGRDLGSSIEVNAGLTTADRVVNNPPDSLAEGQLVRVVRPAAAVGRAGAGGAG
jgi:multidrug efflux pump subunit AcrA (membrane-fusion protein)